MAMGNGNEVSSEKVPWWRQGIERSPRGRILLIFLLCTFLIFFAWLFLSFFFAAGGKYGSRMSTTSMSIALDLGLSNLFPNWGAGSGRVPQAEADVKAISTQLKTYEMTMLTPPSHANGLKALVTRPTSGPNIKRWRQLMKSIPLDPWGNPYVYVYPAIKSTDPYDIYSWGPDRKDGTKDDIGNW